MIFFVYDMLVNVNVIYYVHVCEQARWSRSAGNSAIKKLCIIIIANLATGIGSVPITYKSKLHPCTDLTNICTI